MCAKTVELCCVHAMWSSKTCFLHGTSDKKWSNHNTEKCITQLAAPSARIMLLGWPPLLLSTLLPLLHCLTAAAEGAAARSTATSSCRQLQKILQSKPTYKMFTLAPQDSHKIRQQQHKKKICISLLASYASSNLDVYCTLSSKLGAWNVLWVISSGFY